MRSRTDAIALTLALALTLGPGSLACAAPAAPAEPGPPPTRAQVEQATAALRADPDLQSTVRRKTLRLKPSEPEKRKPDERLDLAWLRGLAHWLGEAGRLLVWALGFLAVAMLVVTLRHAWRVRAEAATGRAAPLPSHVRDLDIRPESLPTHIGPAARALWERGETRAALSLLYRGLLSRLVHVHGVPIRAASTEGECVALAQVRLSAPRGAYSAELIGAWQLAVYGDRQPTTEQVLQLCARFDEQLGQARQGAPA